MRAGRKRTHTGYSAHAQQPVGASLRTAVLVCESVTQRRRIRGNRISGHVRLSPSAHIHPETPWPSSSTWTPRRFNCTPHRFKLEMPPGEEFLRIYWYLFVGYSIGPTPVIPLGHVGAVRTVCSTCSMKTQHQSADARRVWANGRRASNLAHPRTLTRASGARTASPRR